MRHVSPWSIGGNYLCMALVEECEGPPGRARVEGLPQPVEYQDRLIEQSVHDLVVLDCWLNKESKKLSTAPK
jgi:hypothetical protein